MKELKSVHKYFLRYKWHFFGGILFVTGSNYFGILIPQKIREALDLVQQQLLEFKSLPVHDQPLRETDLTSALLYFGLVITLFVVCKGVLMFLMRQTIIVMSRLIEYDMRKDIYTHLQTLDASFFATHQTGDIMARISEDVSKVRNYIGPAVLYAINLVTLFIMTIYAMLKVNVTLSLWALLPLPFLSWSIYVVSDRINKKSTLIQQQLSVLNNAAQETYAGIRVVQSYAKEDLFARFFELQGNEFKKRSLSLARVDAYFQPLISLLIALSTLFVALIGGMQVLDGEVTTGNIAEFILYVNMLTWPVTSIGWIASVIQEAEASQKRINELLHAKSRLVNHNTDQYSLEGTIVLDNVGFTHDKSSRPSLSGIHLQISAGQKVALMGKTGAGKSTLSELLIRMADVTEGTILLDGKRLQDHNLHVLRKRIAYVPQDIFLFSDTLAANISFGTPNADREEILEKTDWVCLQEDIERLPHGMDTLVGERGVTLSGGQKQRIALARALMTKPDILILDDALSAVDAATEQKIISRLREECRLVTTIVVTHRANNNFPFDQIFILDDGHIIDSGTHESLISRPGYYQSVFQQQQAESL